MNFQVGIQILQSLPSLLIYYNSYKLLDTYNIVIISVLQGNFISDSVAKRHWANLCSNGNSYAKPCSRAYFHYCLDFQVANIKFLFILWNIMQLNIFILWINSAFHLDNLKPWCGRQCCRSQLPFLLMDFQWDVNSWCRLEKVKLSCLYSKVKILGTLLCVVGAVTMGLMHSAAPAQETSVNTPNIIFDREKIIGCVYLLAAVFVLSSTVVLQVLDK